MLEALEVQGVVCFFVLQRARPPGCIQKECSPRFNQTGITKYYETADVAGSSLSKSNTERETVAEVSMGSTRAYSCLLSSSDPWSTSHSLPVAVGTLPRVQSLATQVAILLSAYKADESMHSPAGKLGQCEKPMMVDVEEPVHGRRERFCHLGA